jgi:HD-GYP domain-containing protein (c-di-GMP phosphodiesterase class II)
MREMNVMDYTRGRHAIRAAEAATLARDVWAAHRNIDAVLIALGNLLEAFDPYTAEHSQETVLLAKRVARQLGASDQIACVARVAALHDIGKLGIPTGLLYKRGPLNNTERLIMEEHPVIGERILADVPELSELALAIRHEHERWDGRGYPDGMAGEEIPLASRIVLVCDAWHAMTSDRPYRVAMGEGEAIVELRMHAGTQFDPAAAEALIAVVDPLPVPIPMSVTVAR